MARVTENLQRVRIQINQQELNTLLIEPAKTAGYIDFDPTRIMTRPMEDGTFEIVFERVNDGRTETTPARPV